MTDTPKDEELSKAQKAENRRKYKLLWMKMKRASKRPGFNEAWYKEQLDKLKEYPKDRIRISKTNEYHRVQARKHYNTQRSTINKYRYEGYKLLENERLDLKTVKEMLSLIDERKKWESIK